MPDLPPLPPGAKLINGPAPKRDPWAILTAEGFEATNGFRTPGDVQRIRAQGYTPATDGAHNHGDGVDLTHGKLSPAAQAKRLHELFADWDGAVIKDEGHHRHLALPGWGAAPGTPETPNAGMPALPNGAKLVQRGSLRPGNFDPSLIGPPTGQVHDGDTFRMSTGVNARLFGADAFEMKQQGQSPTGAIVPLGNNARAALGPFAQPSATVTPSGGMTYGRPTVSLNNGGDAARSLLDQGLAVAVPEYLKGNPKALNEYMEAERLARLNRHGAWGTTFQTPKAHRGGNPDPWAQPEMSREGKGAAFFFDDPTPTQGLRPEIEAGYLQIWNDPASKPDDLLAFAEANGFKVDPEIVRKSYGNRFKGGDTPDGSVDYLKPPRVLTDLGDGRTGATARGLADPFNALDELGGLANTLGLARDRETIFNSDRRFGDVLDNNVDQWRSILANDDATHPYYRLGGQLASGVAMPYGAGLRTPQALAKLGAIEGGAAGFFAGEGSIGQRVPNAVGGSLLGAGGGLVLGHLADGVGSLLNRQGARASASIEPVQPARESTYEAAPILNDGLQNAGPTPAARSQRSGGSSFGMFGPSRPASAAMRMEDGPATLVGPVVNRERDYLNLGSGVGAPFGQVSRMGEPLDAASIANLFRGADPASVLPRPGNVVTSLEEAMKANPGTIRDLVAPNEMDALNVARIPSPNNLYKSTPMRGPLDITKQLRVLGGIQDQGGELSHLGITNQARRGLPFGGNEQFLGRLINPDGMPLDDAAHKLWEMGYFPEASTRPTVDDLLSRLGQESRGEANYYHPDRMEEVEAFDRAQSDRHMIEQAADEGRPLAEEVGQSIDLDDLIANTPPASAYEDMPRLTGRIGNINLDRLDKPQDIAQALDFVTKRVGGFDAAARGKVRQEETKRLADEMGLTPEQLLRRQPGQALNAEQAYAARTLLQGSLSHLGKVARKAVAGSDADKLEFEKALLKHAAIQEQVAGATAEAGRALQQFRMVAGTSRAQAKAIREYLTGPSAKGDSLTDAAESIIDLMEDPAKANRFIQKAVKPRWRDKLVELYYNSLLSGPRTHAVNIISNAMTAAGSVPEHALAATVGGLRQAARFAVHKAGTPHKIDDRVLFSELGPRMVGLMQGAMDGLRAARYTFKTGKVPDLVTKVEAAQQEAVGGKLGHVLRTPTRALAAEDEFFKAIARRSELASLAVRHARKEGLTGSALKDRIAALTESPTDEMFQQALDFARYQTFQRPVGDVAGGIMRAANAHPWMKLFVPFVRTPTNILKYAAERSPVAPLLKEWRADFMAGGARRDLAMARSVLGTGLGMVVINAAHDGLITGGGPLDQNAERIQRADGWQPYSIKVGDEWVSYQRLDPLALTLGTAADYVEKQSAMTDRQRDDTAMLLTASIIQNLSEKTWLSGLSDALGALRDPVRYGPSAIRRAGAGVAVPAAVSQLEQTIDPTPRETKTVGEAIKARLPGLSDDLRPQLDAWGQPVVKEGGVGPDILSPFPLSTQRGEAANHEALRLRLKVTDPSRTVGGERLDDATFHSYRMRSGELLRQGFDHLMASPDWRQMSDSQRQGAFEDVKAEARATARGELGLGKADDGAPPLPSSLPGLPPLPSGAKLIAPPNNQGTTR